MYGVTIFFSMIFLIGCGHPPLNINNEYYRQAGASGAVLGSYGKVLRDGTYENDGIIADKIDVSIRAQEKYSLIDKSSNKLTINAGLKQAKTSATLSPDNRDEKKSYIALIVTPKDIAHLQNFLLKKIEKDNIFFEKTKNPNFRFITQVISSQHYQDANNLTQKASGSLALSLIGNAAIKTARIEQQSIELSDKTIIGYQFRKLCWKKGKVVDTVIDLPNIKQSCVRDSSEQYPG